MRPTKETYSSIPQALDKTSRERLLSLLNQAIRMNAIARASASHMARDRRFLSLKEIKTVQNLYRKRVVLCFPSGDPRSDGRPLQHPWLFHGARGTACIRPFHHSATIEVQWDGAPGRTCSVGYEGFLVLEQDLMKLEVHELKETK